jgi:MFS family permease
MADSTPGGMSFFHEFSEVIKGNRNIQLIISQAIITQLCFGMFNVIWQPYLVALGTSITQLGIIQGIVTIFSVIGAYLWGQLSDRRGRRPVFIAVIISRLIVFAFTLMATDWRGFIGFGVFMGLSSSWMSSNPVTTTMLSESVERRRISTAIGLYFSVGTILAIASAPWEDS